MSLYKYYFFFLFAFVWMGCAKKTTQHVISTEKLPKIKDKELIAVLDSLHQIKVKTFYTKLSVDYKDTTRDVSFKTSIKNVTDSAVNAIITYARIPIVTAMVTTDSVLVVNKNDKCFTKASLNYIKENFGIDFNYGNIEELILGRPIDYSEEQKYFVVNNPYQYIISSHRKKDRRRLERKAKEDILIFYTLNDQATQIQSMSVESPSDSTNIILDYMSWQNINGIQLPKEVLIFINTPKNNISIRLEYEKVEINEPQELIIIIPESYEKCD
ncbi:MAG: DUF4292 domain-containing protein [Crocinitomicaceae bacterium]